MLEATSASVQVHAMGAPSHFHIVYTAILFF